MSVEAYEQYFFSDPGLTEEESKEILLELLNHPAKSQIRPMHIKNDIHIINSILTLNPSGLEMYVSTKSKWNVYVYAHNQEQLSNMKAFLMLHDKQLLDTPNLPNNTLVVKFEAT